MREGNTYILRFSRLQWETPERLRLACRGCQLAKWDNARFAGLRGSARHATRPAELLPCGPCYKCSSRACSYHPFKAGSPIRLPLRAFNKHILIVRVARAQETNGLPLLPSRLARSLPRGVAWIGPRLRTSNDHHYKWSRQARSFLSPGGWPDWSPTARVQRGESATARCASTGD
jgi:hypothetical protein